MALRSTAQLLRAVLSRFTTALLLCSVAIGCFAEDAKELFTVTGSVIGCDGQHPVHVGLFDASIFDGGDPIEGIIQRPDNPEQNCAVHYRFQAPKGEYTIAAFEDENSNGKLNTLFFIPTEPIAFYKKFSALRRPKFEDVKFYLDKNIDEAIVELD